MTGKHIGCESSSAEPKRYFFDRARLVREQLKPSPRCGACAALKRCATEDIEQHGRRIIDDHNAHAVESRPGTIHADRRLRSNSHAGGCPLHHGGGQRQRLIVSETDFRRDLYHSELATRERAGLVEKHGGHVARLLEATPVADQQAVSSGKRRGDRDDEGGWQESQGVRTRDHQHGDNALDHE